MNKKEERLRALQMTLEKIDKEHQAHQLTKFEEERKIKLDNGLFLDIKKIKDRRWIEDFNSKYVSGLAVFKALDPNKTAYDFINCEIEKINKRVAEIKRIWSLSEDEYYNELSKDKENIDYKKFYLNEYKDTTEEEIKSNILRSKPRTEPSEFEDHRIKLYEQKLDELPKINTVKTTQKQSFQIGLLLAKGEIYSKLIPQKGFRYYHLLKEFENPTQLSNHLNLSRQYINDSLKESESHHNIYKSIKQMRVIIEYCEENKINVCENFKSKYLSLVEKPL